MNYTHILKSADRASDLSQILAVLVGIATFSSSFVLMIQDNPIPAVAILVTGLITSLLLYCVYAGLRLLMGILSALKVDIEPPQSPTTTETKPEKTPLKEHPYFK
jgi:hypothetical protein